MAFDVDGNTVGVAAMAIPVVGSIALFSFLSVAAWSDARRKERGRIDHRRRRHRCYGASAWAGERRAGLSRRIDSAVDRIGPADIHVPPRTQRGGVRERVAGRAASVGSVCLSLKSGQKA